MSYRGLRPSAPRCKSSRGSWRRGHSRTPDSGEPRPGYDPANVMEFKYPLHYSGDAPIINKPRVLGSYSVDSERKFVHDQSMLHFLDRQYLPKEGKINVNLDLTEGSGKIVRYTGNSEESFQNLLRWVVNNQSSLLDSSSEISPDFVTVIGNLVKIMRTPYNFCENWRMCATEFKGTVYLMYGKSEGAKKSNSSMDQISDWGHVFEHHMRGGDPEVGMVANEEYRCVLSTSFAGHSLLYATEIDCVDPEQYKEDFEDMEAFVLLKCCGELTDEKKEKNHRRFHSFRFWAETRLSGIPRILIGYRDKRGTAHTIELLKPDNLPQMSEGAWDPNVSFNFLNQFLAFVKERVKTEPGAAFIFENESRARGHIYCRKLSGSEHINLLPSWYTNQMFADKESEKD